MARPQKKTVEYFPHFAKGGRTIYILEAKFGNDGYAFWFKILELLCETEGQVYDCGNAVNWEFLTAKTRVSDEKAREILQTLASLEAIDPELWNERNTIWVENLVNNLTPLYSRRNVELPKRPTTDNGNEAEPSYCLQKPDSNSIPEAETPQRKVKESKVKESKEIEGTPDFDLQEIVNLWNGIVGKPEVAKLSQSRQDKIKARFKDWKVGTQQEANEKAEKIFRLVRGSDFLTGKNSSSWKATFDWVFANDKNYLKILEGNYENSPSAKAGKDPRLGVGEFITDDGRRTYGTGKANIPMDAAPRPSSSYSWDAESRNWIIQ